MSETSTLVLGLGNVICGDDGVGIIALERLRRGFKFPGAGLSLVDGGTQGLALLAILEEADEVWILDAVEADAPPGTLVALEGEAVEPALRERLSPHQIGVADLLDAMQWRGTWPARVRVLGLVPDDIGLRVGLSEPVARNLETLVQQTVRELREAGHVLESRDPDADASPPDDDRDRIARALGL
jgi:hydrogenase maturation protease